MMTDPDLAARLRELGADLTAAQTPDLSGEIGRRIRADVQPAPAARRPRRAMIAAAVATALIGGTAGAALASPRVRSALGDLIRFHGIAISHSTGAPPSDHRRSAPVPQDLELGTQVTYATAQRAATFQIRQLHAVGDPQWVLLMQPGGSAVVTLAYPPGPKLPRSRVTGTGAVLTEFAGNIDRIVFRKVLYGIAHTRATRVNAAPAIFAAGPQRLFLVDTNVGSYGLAPRTSANSLIWATGGVTYRLEAQLPLTRLRALAESIG